MVFKDHSTRGLPLYCRVHDCLQLLLFGISIDASVEFDGFPRINLTLKILPLCMRWGNFWKIMTYFTLPHAAYPFSQASGVSPCTVKRQWMRAKWSLSPRRVCMSSTRHTRLRCSRIKSQGMQQLSDRAPEYVSWTHVLSQQCRLLNDIVHM